MARLTNRMVPPLWTSIMPSLHDIKDCLPEDGAGLLRGSMSDSLRLHLHLKVTLTRSSSLRLYDTYLWIVSSALHS